MEFFEEGVDYPAVSVDADYQVTDEAVDAARKAFGVKYLFPWQRLVIGNIMDAADMQQDSPAEGEENDYLCRGRQIVLLPTGAGKSLCFLTPALLLKGPSLVLYPLLALMSDQQRRMEAGGLKCAVFRGGQTEEERRENLDSLKKGARIILTNPETLQNDSLVEELSQSGISHIAIDEAHCVAEWGDTFRPAYLTLGKIIKKLGCRIVTAFTATASPQVLARISEVLFDGDAHIVQSGADRANIHYEVRPAYARMKNVLKAVTESEKPLIVFCGTRNRTEQVARLIESYYEDGRTKFYHAGLTKEEKNSIEKWFFESKDGILCATCAYGMGVDKADIRTVIHMDAPLHLENFIQEAGRAGRNGDNVRSILLWNHNDDIRFKGFPQGSREKAVSDFARLNACRRRFILDYLNDQTEFSGCSGCDYCDAVRSGRTFKNQAEDARTVTEFIRKHRKTFTVPEAKAEVKKLLNANDLDEYKMNIWEEKDINEIFSQLLSERTLKVAGGLWANHVDIVPEKKLKAAPPMIRFIPRNLLHRLHCLRRLLRRVQEQVQQIFS